MMEGDNFIQSEDPSNTNKDHICIYYKVFSSMLTESLACEVTIQTA